MNRRTLKGLAAAVASVALVATASAAMASAASTDDPGIGITVVVSPAPTTSTPTPTSSPSPSSTRTSNNGGTVVTGGESPVPSSTPKPGEYSIGGLIYISGLNSDGQWTVNPASTEATLRFTVHNVSSSAINSKATFWVEGPFANQLGTERVVQIRNLKPDETRVVEATVSGLGQWTFLHGHTTFTPPKKVDGQELEPVNRDQFFVVFPWLIAIVVIAGVATYLIVRLVRTRPVAEDAA